MELIPESAQADNWFGPFLFEDVDAADQLRDLGREVTALVPACVGMSLSLVEHGVTFTVASRNTTTALLDAVQYTDDGPCLRAMADARPLRWSADDLETSWHAFAVASASEGVASSLSLPIVRLGQVVGGFNLYAATQHAFDAHHERLAGLLGAWAEGATTNADLGFATRDLARLAPELLRDELRLSVAAVALARAIGCEPETAIERMRRAAEQSSLPLSTLVDSLVRIFDIDDRA